MGLVNKVVPRRPSWTPRWTAGAREIVERSPTAIAIAKRVVQRRLPTTSRGIVALGMQALKLYYDSAESKEGAASFLEKRKPDFRRYYK